MRKGETRDAAGNGGIARRQDALARRRAPLNFWPRRRHDRTGLAAGATCPACGLAPSPSPSSTVSSVALSVSNSGLETPRATQTTE
jgi:hypothetical protein